MTTLPKLPESILSLPEGKYTFQVEAQHIHREHFYSEAQMLEFQRLTVEACAALCDADWSGDSDTYVPYIAYNECAEAIRAMLKEKTE